MFGVATIFTGSQLQTLILGEHLKSQIHSSSFDRMDTQSLFFVRIVPWVSRRLEKALYMRLLALSKDCFFSRVCGCSEFSCSVTSAFEAFSWSFCYPIWDRTKLALRAARKGGRPSLFLSSKCQCRICISRAWRGCIFIWSTVRAWSDMSSLIHTVSKASPNSCVFTLRLEWKDLK